MRVLIVHTEYQFRGGEDTVVNNELELLKQNNVVVDKLLFSNTGNALIKFLQLPFNIGSYFKTRNRIRQFKPDVVHIHNLHFAASLSVIYAIKKSNIPCVLTVHNYRMLCPTATLFFDGKEFSESLKQNFGWTAVYKGVYNNSRLLTFWLSISIWLSRALNVWQMIDRFIVLTKHTKQIITTSSLNIEADKIVIKPNFTSGRINENVKRGAHFLYVGRLSVEKGVRLMLEAFHNAPFSLRIVGDGPLKAEVMSFAEANANVTYLGFADKNMIDSELERCSALVFPSIWYETFGLTIIEAFATSTPVIAANIGAPSTIVENNYNGILYEPLNILNLREKLNYWQHLPEADKEAFGERAQASYLKHFTPEKNFQQLSSIYKSVINNAEERVEKK